MSRDRLKRTFLAAHKLGLRVGIQMLPAHYYSPAPDILKLEQSREQWAKASDMPGVDVDLDEQLARLKTVCGDYESEYRGNKTYLEAASNGAGPGFGYIEAQCLHSVIRHYKPRQIIEVGSGVSTICMLQALKLNEKESDVKGSLTAIEPNPSEKLKGTKGIQLTIAEVQSVPFESFSHLGHNDFLFIDSSHAVKPGGDVNYLILEVLPRLKPGVIVHFHDICFPYDYQPDTLMTFLHGMETSLLHAFLIGNTRVKILFCLSQLHYQRSEDLKAVFPDYVPKASENGLNPKSQRPFETSAGHFPSSIYFQIVA